MGKANAFIPAQVAGDEVVARDKGLGRLRPLGEHGVVVPVLQHRGILFAEDLHQLCDVVLGLLGNGGGRRTKITAHRGDRKSVV